MRVKSYPRRVPLREPTQSDTREYVQQYDESCTSLEALRRINRDVHTKVEPHRCGNCGKTFMTECELRNHERINTCEKLYQCEFCDKSFNRKHNLVRHKVIHINRKPYNCHDCGNNFQRKENLKRHIISKHIAKRKCAKCSFPYVYHSEYVRHTRKIHTGENPYVCKICGKACASKCDLCLHRIVHRDKKKIQCSVCGKDYKYKRSLWVHIQKLHN